MGRVDQHVGTAARFAESLVAFRCGKQVSAFIDAPAILRCWSATYVICYAEFAREWKISRARYVPVRRNFVIFSVLSVFQKSLSSAFSIRSEAQADSITRSNETEICIVIEESRGIDAACSSAYGRADLPFAHFLYRLCHVLVELAP